MKPALGRVLRAGALLLAGQWLVIANGWAAPLSMREIAPGIYFHQGVIEEWGPANRGDVGNLGFIVGERCVAVIDTGGTAEIGAALKAEVRRVTALPVCYAVSPPPHPSQGLANDAFHPAGTYGPQCAATQRPPAALGARGPFYLNALVRDFGEAQRKARLVPPTLLVQNTLELDLGGRTLVLRAWQTAHTDADLSVFDTRTRTLFLGDLLFRDHTPVVDGRLKGWLAVMETLSTEPVALAIPGHGEPGSDWPGVLAPQQRYLKQLQTDVRAALKAGWTLKQAVERIAPEPGPWRLLDAFHARNVTAAYAELEWED
jgi:quinoprotein relay system zinc metallohydrolase 2